MNPRFLYLNFGAMTDLNEQKVAVSDPVLKKVSFCDLDALTIPHTASINANRLDSISTAQFSGPPAYKAYWAIDSDNSSSIKVYDQTGSLRNTLSPLFPVGQTYQGLRNYASPGNFTTMTWTSYTSDGVTHTLESWNGGSQNQTFNQYDIGTTFSPVIKLYTATNGFFGSVSQLYVEGQLQNALAIYNLDNAGGGSISGPLGTCSFNSRGFGGGFIYSHTNNRVYLGAFNNSTGNPEIWEWNPTTLQTSSVYDLTFLRTNNNVITASALYVTTEDDNADVRLYLMDSHGIFGWNVTTRAFICSQSFNCTASAYGQGYSDLVPTNILYIPSNQFTGSANGGVVVYS